MGMWIRSQDKLSLRHYKGIFINCNDRTEICGDASFQEKDAESYFVLGTYKTEERTKEVLDSIQKQLIRGVQHDDLIGGRRYMRNYVFQMPRE